MEKHNWVMTVGVQSMADLPWHKANDCIKKSGIGLNTTTAMCPTSPACSPTTTVLPAHHEEALGIRHWALGIGTTA
jgi:hypothetical protein